MAFAARLKDAVDLDLVADDLAQVASRALEPAARVGGGPGQPKGTDAIPPSWTID